MTVQSVDLPKLRGLLRLSCPMHIAASAPDRAGIPADLITRPGRGRHPGALSPESPPKICTQSAINIPPDVGARYRQDLAYGSEEWHRTYATCRNTIEGTNGYVKDTAHESLQAPGRRRVRGIAAQSVFVGLLLVAANIRRSPPTASLSMTTPRTRWPSAPGDGGPASRYRPPPREV